MAFLQWSYHFLWLSSFFWHRCLLLASAAFGSVFLWGVFLFYLPLEACQPFLQGRGGRGPVQMATETCDTCFWEPLWGKFEGWWDCPLPEKWARCFLSLFHLKKNDHMPLVLIIFLEMSWIQILLLLWGKQQKDELTNHILWKVHKKKLKKNLQLAFCLGVRSLMVVYGAMSPLPRGTFRGPVSTLTVPWSLLRMFAWRMDGASERPHGPLALRVNVSSSGRFFWLFFF